MVQQSPNFLIYFDPLFILQGDIGHFGQDGFLFVTDRLKELIKYKGFQVISKAI